MYGDGIGGIMLFLVIVGAVIASIVWGFVNMFSDDSIKSKAKIEPQIELIIESNKVDTLFVYRVKED